ncbi:hypothetical protein F1880_010266 [Penicillium rolfsii]|nr:hypothetical protein F1880_010266 [Penicillium rolfsii]
MVTLEAELEVLMRRVNHLEFQAVNLHKLPDNLQQTTLSAIEANEKISNFVCRPSRSISSGQGSNSAYCLTQQQNLNQPAWRQRTPLGPEENIPSYTQPSAPVGDLDEDDTDKENETGATRAVREEDISILPNHVQKQAEEINFQKDIIAQVRR